MEIDLNYLVRVFAIVGGLLCVLFGFLTIIEGAGHGASSIERFAESVADIVAGIIVIVIGLLVLSSYGILDLPARIETTWLMLIVLGLIALIFGGDIGAVLLILAGFLSLLEKSMKETS